MITNPHIEIKSKFGLVKAVFISREKLVFDNFEEYIIFKSKSYKFTAQAVLKGELWHVERPSIQGESKFDKVSETVYNTVQKELESAWSKFYKTPKGLVIKQRVKAWWLTQLSNGIQQQIKQKFALIQTTMQELEILINATITP